MVYLQCRNETSKRNTPRATPGQQSLQAARGLGLGGGQAAVQGSKADQGFSKGVSLDAMQAVSKHYTPRATLGWLELKALAQKLGARTDRRARGGGGAGHQG